MKGSDRDFNALKKHPFFEGIDFFFIEKQKVPIPSKNKGKDMVEKNKNDYNSSRSPNFRVEEVKEDIKLD